MQNFSARFPIYGFTNPTFLFTDGNMIIAGVEVEVMQWGTTVMDGEYPSH